MAPLSVNGLWIFEKAVVHADSLAHTDALPITVWDNTMGPLYMYHTFVFTKTLESTIVQRSLKKTLHCFPQFAGRLRSSQASGGAEVVCNNAGCPLLTAVCSNSITDFTPAEGATTFTPVDMQPVHSLFGMPMICSLAVDKDVPLLSVVLLKAQGGGCCLVVGFAHVLGDHHSMRNFMKHWTATARQMQGTCQAPSQATAGLSNSEGAGAAGVLSQPASEGSATDSTPPANDSVGPPAAPPSDNQNQQHSSSAHSQQAPRDGLPVSYPTPSVMSYIEPSADLISPEGHSYISAMLFKPSVWDTLRVLCGGMIWHTGIRDHITSLVLRVTSTWLADLKAAASEQLQHSGLPPGNVHTADSTETANGNASGQPTSQRPSDGSATAASSVSSQPTSGPRWISTNDALVAWIWQLLGSLPSRKDRPFSMTLPVNVRSRLQPPLPPTTMGNWVLPHVLPTLQPGKHQLGELAAKLRALIPTAAASFVGATTYLSDPQVAKSVVPRLVAMFPGGPVMMSNWDWERGELDFGDAGGGPAVWFQGTSSWHRHVCMVTMTPALHGDGVFVQFKLHTRVIEQLKAELAARGML